MHKFESTYIEKLHKRIVLVDVIAYILKKPPVGRFVSPREFDNHIVVLNPIDANSFMDVV